MRIAELCGAFGSCPVRQLFTGKDDARTSTELHRLDVQRVKTIGPSSRGREKRTDVLIQHPCREEPAPTGIAFDRLLEWFDDGVEGLESLERCLEEAKFIVS
jgi:hypothetical protein